IADFTGQTFAQAKAALEQQGLTPVEFDDYTDAVQTGQVFATDPPKGATAEVGSRVTVKVSKGPKTITVPDVRGRTVDQATGIMQQAGLQVTGVFGPHGTKGHVITTDPQSGAKVPRGSGV